MLNKLFFPALLVLICLSFAPAQLCANEFDYHILNAGINLGWAEATVQLLGVDAGTVPYLTGVLSNATAHLSAAQSLIDGTMWEFIQLPSVSPEIDRFLTFTSGWSQGQQVNYIQNVFSRIHAKLAQYNAGGGFVYGPTCPSYLFQAGYHFGRGHIGMYTGNGSYHSSASGSFINAVQNGLAIAPSRGCDFATLAEWNALPYDAPFSMAVYADTLYPMQVLAWGLNGFADPPPPASPSSLPPLPSIPASFDLSGRWPRPNGVVYEFRRTASGYNGYMIVVPESYRTSYGFSQGELGIVIDRTGGQRFYGKSKWRFADGRVEWKDLIITVQPDGKSVQFLEVNGNNWITERAH